MEKAAFSLAPGCLLKNGEYKILEVLGHGGFGITYKAEQTGLGRVVAIKEFFMKDFCEREEGSTGVSLGTVNNQDMMESYMAKFVKEAKTISQLENPHIVKIIDIFNANNTAYYVMEYIDGRSVADIIKESGPLGESTAISYIRQAAEALRTVHANNFMHLDVKPTNMMVSSKDGRLVLIDFGLAKRYDVSSHMETSTTPVAISHGYAPLEQYKAGGVSTFSPQADIYSLGASLYKMLTGITPPQAPELVGHELPAPEKPFSAPVSEAIKRAMAVLPENRPANVGEFMEILSEGHTVVLPPPVKEPVTAPAEAKTEPVAAAAKPVVAIEKPAEPVADKPADPRPAVSDRPVKKSHTGVYLGLLAALLVLAAAIFVLIRQLSGNPLFGDSDRGEAFREKMVELTGNEDWSEDNMTEEDWVAILEQVADDFNEDLPMDFDGFILSFVDVDKDEKGFYYYFLVDDDWEDFKYSAEVIGYDEMKASSIRGLVDECKTNEELVILLQVMQKAGYYLYYVYYEDDEYDMKIYSVAPQEVLSKL